MPDHRDGPHTGRVRPATTKLGFGDSPPPGATLHIAARGEDGKIRVIEVWDSRDEAEAFGKKVLAVREEAGFGDAAPPISYFELHNFVQ